MLIRIASLSVVVGVGFAAVAAVLFVSWKQDVALLQEVALRETAAYETVAQKVTNLNSYVYCKGGFAKNRGYYILKRWGPTPIQVLENGGDCADKSRLLSSLLAQIGVDSTLAMLYPCYSCPPGHTVVEARYEAERFALDPVYNIDFPDPSGGFLGLDDLSQDQESLATRIDELKAERGPTDKINWYNYEKKTYRFVRTVNWDRNWMTRMVGSTLGALGYEPFFVRRPHFLEDPKLFVALVAATLCFCFVVLGATCALAAQVIRSRRTSRT